VIDQYIEDLGNPTAKIWLQGLLHLLREIGSKENLTPNDLELVHRLFLLLPRRAGDRDRIEFLLDKLSSK
jgi:hypothetical protein